LPFDSLSPGFPASCRGKEITGSRSDVYLDGGDSVAHQDDDDGRHYQHQDDDGDTRDLLVAGILQRRVDVFSGGNRRIVRTINTSRKQRAT